MKFEKVRINFGNETEKIYEDSLLLGTYIKNHLSLNESLRKIALSRNVTPNSVRANVCTNLGLRAADWHDFADHSINATNRIANALINRYPEKRNDILKIFPTQGK